MSTIVLSFPDGTRVADVQPILDRAILELARHNGWTFARRGNVYEFEHKYVRHNVTPLFLRTLRDLPPCGPEAA